MQKLLDMVSDAISSPRPQNGHEALTEIDRMLDTLPAHDRYIFLIKYYFARRAHTMRKLEFITELAQHVHDAQLNDAKTQVDHELHRNDYARDAERFQWVNARSKTNFATFIDFCEDMTQQVKEMDEIDPNIQQQFVATMQGLVNSMGAHQMEQILREGGSSVFNRGTAPSSDQSRGRS